MAFSFANAKKLVRRVVHDTLAVPALYQDAVMSTPADIRARWHSKIERTGDLEGEGWAQVIEGVDRIIFNSTDARTLNLKRGGTVTFPAYNNATFILDTREEVDGPDEEIWLVSRG